MSGLGSKGGHCPSLQGSEGPPQPSYPPQPDIPNPHSLGQLGADKATVHGWGQSLLGDEVVTLRAAEAPQLSCALRSQE